MSFIFKYTLAFTPVILVFLCIIARYVLEIIFNIFHTIVDNSSVGPMIIGNPAPELGLANGAMNTLLPNSLLGAGPVINGLGPAISYGTNITVLLIAPVGIFIIFAAIGWSMRIAEMWTGVALTLALSAIVGLFLVTMTGAGILQDKFLVYLKWIAFLVQPFSILATIISLIWLEKFRQSVQYTISEMGVTIKGGIWQIQEHIIPHCQIVRVVLEQNIVGIRYNFGTVIPISHTPWGEETAFRGIGASAQKDNIGGGVMFAKGRKEASRSPLDCLYGIPDPKKAQKILSEFCTRQAVNEAEQVSYLKRIYENGTNGEMTGRAKAPSTGIRYRTNDEELPESPEGTSLNENIPEEHYDTIIRVNDIDELKTTPMYSHDNVREIPPSIHPKNTPQHTNTHAESIPDLIIKMAELRDAGIISEADFEAKKKELLKRI